jgi:23S rRNA (uracil1939-C5)-methyltransferase
MSQPVTLTVEKIVAGGDGLAFLDGKAVFVPFSAPGETVQCDIAEDRRDFLIAGIPEIREASPDRIEPPCPVYRVCGGCNLQHLRYERQLEIKETILREALARIGKLEAGAIRTVASRAFAYRNRVQFHAASDGTIGFMKKASSLVVPVSGCPIAAGAVQDWMAKNREISGIDWGKQSPLASKNRFLVFGYDGWTAVEGRDTVVTVPIAEKQIRFHLKGFFQSNVDMLAALVPELLDGLSGDRVLDLYCGVGTFTAFLADRFASAVGVEHNPHAVAMARTNVPSADFHDAPAEEWVLAPSAGNFDAVVVDPPRTGLTEPVRSFLKRSRPAKVRYLSCDPVTLARDLGDLCGFSGGTPAFRIAAVSLYDFYPQTSHIETLVSLEANGA